MGHRRWRRCPFSCGRFFRFSRASAPYGCILCDSK
nr:MAG TPA: hypothetical protein [Caudoviricetes sp.]